MLQLLTRSLPRQYWQELFVETSFQQKHNSLLCSASLKVSTCFHGHMIVQQHRCLASSFFRNPKRIESYFSAIGGESDDPPPDLTPEQVTTILRTNESLILNNKIAGENERFLENFIDVLESKKLAKNKKFEALRKRKFSEEIHSKKLYSLIDHAWVAQVESNQLASNHPIEDRLRISTLNLESQSMSDDNLSLSDIEVKSEFDDKGILFGVFDGHGGGFCADIIARRLFHYIAIGLKVLHLRTFGLSQQIGPQLSSMAHLLAKISTDHSRSPSRFYHNIYTLYEEQVAKRLEARIEEFEFESLERFANEELERLSSKEDEINAIRCLLQRAFIRCDQDLSKEIEVNLINTTSNVLLHYYHSLAVSGCCATLVLVYRGKIFVASAGDCRAVMGLLKGDQLPLSSNQSSPSSLSSSLEKSQLRVIALSREHNSDNVNELNRIYSEHPKEEHNFIIREHRLLGQLMPLRAFGDFSFKWTVDKMKQLGLTRAFGSHVIPTFYRTPPYLTAEPEVTTFDLEQDDQVWIDRFIILATDGLWEQFESPRKVVKAVNRYRQNWYKQIMAYTSAQVFNIEPMDGNQRNPLTLQQIITRLSEQVKQGPVNTFKRITADDDLIEDINCGTFLLRTALCDISTQTVPRPNVGRSTTSEMDMLEEEREKFSHHVDQYEQQRRRHSKLVSYLTLPQSVVRNFRDDISLIVIGLK